MVGGKNVQVTTRRKEYSDSGTQLAEFDVEVSGKLGTGEFRWLIECRDRPSGGAAPKSWIEQMPTRRDFHGFHKVTAVSTTGFAEGARQVAEKYGIELREVRKLEVDSFAGWISDVTGTVSKPLTYVRRADLRAAVGEPVEKVEAAGIVLANAGIEAPLLVDRKVGKSFSVARAFHVLAGHTPEAFAGVEPNGPAKPFNPTLVFQVPLPEVDSPLGAVQIASIKFEGEVAMMALQTRSSPKNLKVRPLRLPIQSAWNLPTNSGLFLSR
jgi:hypothetical protein